MPSDLLLASITRHGMQFYSIAKLMNFGMSLIEECKEKTVRSPNLKSAKQLRSLIDLPQLK